MNALGVLTYRYDLDQDVMNPENFPRLGTIQADWTTAAWPKDNFTEVTGRHLPDWRVTAKDGEKILCSVICDLWAVAYARERISPELATHQHLGRFIDTTNAAQRNECYDPAHPMTRTPKQAGHNESPPLHFGG